MLRDYFILAFKDIGNRKLRSWLTMIGIFIGIAAVVALISIGQGMQEAVKQQFEKLGSNRITISAKGTVAGPFSSGISSRQLTEDDVNAVRKVKGVDAATGTLAVGSVPVSFKGELKYLYVMGFDTDPETTKIIKNIDFLELEKGRNPTGGYEAALGYTYANKTFEKNPQVGSKIVINGKDFQVVGIQKKVGATYDIIIRVPKSTLKEVFGITNENVASIFVTTKEGFNPADVADDIKKALRKERNVKKGEEDFNVETAEDIFKSFSKILNVVQIVLVGIAAISLLVGGVGIMNTMYTAVLERTREIGIMKAIGARNSDVLLLFLIESGLLGMTGGAIGVAIGVGLSKLVEIIAVQALGTTYLRAYFPWYLIVGSLAFSFLVGTLSGILPARQASRMKPVDALRH